MFIAALISRSWCVLHSGHVHSRIFNGIDSFTNPQLEQRFELGKKRSISEIVRPAHSALYLSWRTNSPQLASAMCFASLGLRIIFFTANDSIQTTWFSFISLRDNLCKLSNRLSAIFACRHATFWRALLRFLLPFCFLASLRCS